MKISKDIYEQDIANFCYDRNIVPIKLHDISDSHIEYLYIIDKYEIKVAYQIKHNYESKLPKYVNFTLTSEKPVISVFDGVSVFTKPNMNEVIECLTIL